jgi:hypothetical protein
VTLRSSAHAHRLSAGTHTVEMAQIADLNARLVGVPGPTAAQLGLDGARVRQGSADPLPGAAVLTRVCWAGAPAFPDVQAVFGPPSGPGARLLVDLHTQALQALSHHLGLRQTWGLGPRRVGP